MSIADLPALNATLNALATVFLILGFILIKQGKREAHMKAMWTAFGVSAVFLSSYLLFHYTYGSIRFLGEGAIRPIYFTILISHIVLAIVIVPMILITMWRSITKQYEAHKRIARITWPIWMYVSVTGVIIYLMMNAYDSYAHLQ